MNLDLVFRSGKYEGYTVGEVSYMDPSYIRWVKENRPEMLQPKGVRKATPQKPPQMSEEDVDMYNWNKGIRPASPEEAFEI